MAQQGPDFTGTYTLKSITRSDSSRTIVPDKSPQLQYTLKITQHADLIEFSYTFANGHNAVRRYNLDGTDSTNLEFDGTPETDRAAMKDGAITINSKRKAPGRMNDKLLYGISKWELSRDLKTLTLHRWLHIQGMHPAGDTLTGNLSSAGPLFWSLAAADLLAGVCAHLPGSRGFECYRDFSTTTDSTQKVVL